MSEIIGMDWGTTNGDMNTTSPEFTPAAVGDGNTPWTPIPGQDDSHDELAYGLVSAQDPQTSFPLGSSTEGETQLATRAQDELMEFIDHPTGVTEMTGPEIKQEDLQGQSSSLNGQNLDLGASIFSSQGKRKATPSPEDELIAVNGQPLSKKSKLLQDGREDVEDFPVIEVNYSLGARGNGYTLDTEDASSLPKENDHPGANAVPRSFIMEDDEEAARAADQQLQMESLVANGEAPGAGGVN